MGWTAYYQVVRETPLTEAEIASVAELVRKQRRAAWDAEPFSLQIARAPRPDRVIAAGWNKLAMSEDSNDGALLEHALDELAKLVGGELRVRDDFGAYTRGPQLVQMKYGELIDPETLVAANPVAVTGGGVDALLDALLASDNDSQKKQLDTALAAFPGGDVVHAIFRRYRELSRSFEVRHVLTTAERRVADPASVASGFLEAWRNPDGTYFYGDMPLEDAFVVGLGKVPEVVAQWTADVAAAMEKRPTDLVKRCAERAIQCLARAGHIKPVIETIRSVRHKNRGHDVEYYVYLPAHRFLMERKDPRTIPTLMLWAATERKRGWWTTAITTIIDLAPERVRPWAMELARRGVHRRRAIEWMQKLGEHSLAQQLAARFSDPVTSRAVDVDYETRHEALKEIEKRRDPSTYVSLVLAESLDKFLRARSDDNSLPFTWYDWKPTIEGDGIDGTTAKKLKWFELIGKHRLPPQVIWPEVAEIQTLGAGAVAARYPSEFLEVPADQLAALEAEEAALIAAS